MTILNVSESIYLSPFSVLVGSSRIRNGMGNTSRNTSRYLIVIEDSKRLTYGVSFDALIEYKSRVQTGIYV